MVERGYPLVAMPAIAEVDPALLLAIGRQEILFNPVAISSAGAQGILQIMPATAKTVARKSGLPYSKKRLIQDPDYNVLLAGTHLRGLLKRYDGSYVLSIAAYNAGEGRVSRWIRAYGDPRWPDVDPIDWIESLPFDETRNYVQRVLENLQVYRLRLASDAPLLRLAQDLARGS
jgi:soluble lytic murein transglycosylase